MTLKRAGLISLLILFHGLPAFADSCGEMDVLDVDMGMCMPLTTPDMQMSMLMLHGSGFATYVSDSGPRGRDAFTAPDWFMFDAGTSVGSRHYLNADLMGTFEKWTFPQRGYPLLLQIGESNSAGQPFIDAQHPHSSPVMGLTLSDTIRLDTGDKDNLKLFFAPRGESTDGPIAFMHRATGVVNPDAPLGHHIGQDVGHITSTVIGASLKLSDFHIEASTFHGQEPQPTHVDLPIGAPDSVALRLVRDFSADTMAMISAAYVRNPEESDSTIPFVARYSASLYHSRNFGNWHLDNALIGGLITKYDHVGSLMSFAEEFAVKNDKASLIFGRFEAVQRSPEELLIASSSPSDSHWVAAATLGYTHTILKIDGAELGAGGSMTKDFLPSEFIDDYGGDPWSGKVFVRLSGMKMWDL